MTIQIDTEIFKPAFMFTCLPNVRYLTWTASSVSSVTLIILGYLEYNDTVMFTNYITLIDPAI